MRKHAATSGVTPTHAVLNRFSINQSIGPSLKLYDQWMLDAAHEKIAAGNPKPPPPVLYLEWVLEAWYDGVTKDTVINSFKVCGIGAIGGAGDHLIHYLKQGNGTPTELAEILAGFEIEAPDEDDTGHISDVEVIDDEPAASNDESIESEEKNPNLSDDSDF
ncbi:Protein W02H5.4 [Aphelenchoides avenae]|nr:Protein W02H5.4 [Aphelenchus avenae]